MKKLNCQKKYNKSLNLENKGDVKGVEIDGARLV
jgi:hypothetical protein